ncbi:EamA family transporter [Rhizobium etli]|nr:EamA family transporter [Rhizobium etli]
MSVEVFFLVLLSAVMHAAWNSLTKVNIRPYLALAALNIIAGLFASVALVFIGLPHGGWLLPAIAASGLRQCYYLLMAKAYQGGDLSQVYPVARGTAPVLTTILAIPLLGDHMSITSVIALCLIMAGVMIVGLARSAGSITTSFSPLALALAAGATISCFTMLDAWGSRAASSAISYGLVGATLDGVIFLAIYALFLRKELPERYISANALQLAAGSLFVMASYVISVWAVTVAPVALVSALRETNILFGLLIAVTILKETLNRSKMIGSFAILTGLVLLRLA